VAAGVNITYKILYNDAVAMTGGQEAEGHLTVPQIAAQLVAEGVGRVAIASERPEVFRTATLPAGVSVHDRRQMMRLQEEMRDTTGVTAIIYDQTCAAEKRRRRKRGRMPDPPRRVVINDLVCEGCGDCSKQSNCVSIEPLETALGRKRRINQSSCNKDFSCLEGFCPSFVTVEGGRLRKSRAGMGEATLPDVPEPALPALGDAYNILVTGIGGTGVLTIGALLGVAAHLEGRGCSVLDMSGLAQKGGAVLSHVRLFGEADGERSPRIITGGTDLLLACDAVVAAGKEAQQTLARRRSRAVINTDLTPVADFVRDRDFDFHPQAVLDAIAGRTRKDKRFSVAASTLAESLMGDAIAANIFLLGFAWQKGFVPLARSAIEEAIRLNGVAEEMNLRSFHWGRVAAHDMAAVTALASPEAAAHWRFGPETLDELIAHRAEELVRYQSPRLARRYLALVARVRERERSLGCDGERLTETVARQYFRLLAYKDEYEVARLFAASDFESRLKARFEGDIRLRFHLAPPLLSPTDAATGRPRKREFGPWISSFFRVLARLRWLRGTPFDPFGWSAERRLERRLIAEYESLVADILARIDAGSLEIAVALAGVPDMIRGYGPVKLASIAAAKKKEAELRHLFLDPPPKSGDAIAA
ncbi:MAG: indolepyruvate ferredoxin oxidoreductase family protein, partial [Rhodothalassiaceae bacterium]